MSSTHVASVALLAVMWVGAVGCGSDDSPTAPSPVCTYTIAPPTSAFTADGGSGSVAVTAPASCAWSASAGASWLTITGQSSGSGSGSVAYSVAAATTTDARSATLTIAGETHTVTQQGRTPVTCTYDIAPATADVGAEETGGTFTVTAPSTPGAYKMRWRMYRASPSYTNFFGDYTTEKTITVTQ